MNRLHLVLLLAFAPLACQGLDDGPPQFTRSSAPNSANDEIDIRGIDGQGIDIRPMSGLKVRYAKLDEAAFGIGAIAVDLSNFTDQAFIATVGDLQIPTPPAANGAPGVAPRLTFRVESSNGQRLVTVTSGKSQSKVQPKGAFTRSAEATAPRLAPRSASQIAAGAPRELLVDVQGLEVVLRIEKAP